MRNLKHFVINLERSADRRRAMEGKLAELGLRYVIVPALDGLDDDFPFVRYKRFYYPFWGNRDSFKPGAFACYLSHARCWQEIAEGDAPCAVVLEDDVSFNRDNLRSFAHEVLERPFDVIFINRRMEQWISAASLSDDRPLIEVPALLENLVLCGAFKTKVKAPGTDGYIVSKQGARKLLEMLASRKVCMGVDYAMALNSLPGPTLQALERATNGRLPRELAFHREREATLSDDIALSAFVYNEGFLVKPDGSPSTLGHSVRLDAEAFESPLDPGDP